MHCMDESVRHICEKCMAPMPSSREIIAYHFELLDFLDMPPAPPEINQTFLC